jgi:hypothetical protein
MDNPRMSLGVVEWVPQRVMRRVCFSQVLLKRLFCVRHNRLAFKCCVPGRGIRGGVGKASQCSVIPPFGTH